MTEQGFEFSPRKVSTGNVSWTLGRGSLFDDNGVPSPATRLVLHWAAGDQVLLTHPGKPDIMNLVRTVLNCVPEPVATALLAKAGGVEPPDPLPARGPSQVQYWVTPVTEAKTVLA